MRHDRGFTMIELLLALMLTAMLTSALSMMIGQAARDRQALRQDHHTPDWTNHALHLLERDLLHAEQWAAADDRLVLIGYDTDGLPAKIEYRWEQWDGRSSFSRQAITLAGNDDQPNGEICVVALDLKGIAIGAYRFGDIPLVQTDAQDSARQTTSSTDQALSGPSLIVNGRRIPLRHLPERLGLVLALSGDQAPVIQREVILR